MSPAAFAALLGFAFVATVTPGPNNLMLMASGANFGFRRSLPHMFGILFGFTAMIALVGLGLMGVFEAVPGTRLALTFVSATFLLYLAWKIATAAPPDSSRATQGRPLTLLQAAAFQWVNPKAWAMVLSAITLYAPGRSTLAVLIVAGAFGIVSFPAISIWTWAGTVLRRWLSDPVRLRVFNMTMAALLVATLYPVLRAL